MTNGKIASLAVLMAFLLMMGVPAVFATTTVSVSPASPTAGQSFTVFGSADSSMTLFVDYGGSTPNLSICGGLIVFSATVGPGPYSVTVPGSVTAGKPGSYSATFFGGTPCATFNVLPTNNSVPEFPLGFALLFAVVVPAMLLLRNMRIRKPAVSV
jgi:hypothetical protein